MRYRVLDLPVKGLGAFLPTPTMPPLASSFGLVRRTGSPGTQPVPVQGPTRVWAPVPSGLDQLQGGNISPDFFLPDIYVAYNDNMGPAADAGVGMATRRHTPIPLPALTWIRTPRPAMTGMRVGGRAASPMPRAFQRFPSRA